MDDLCDLMGAPVAPRPTARDLAEEGMNRAVEHADAEEPGWSERAYRLLFAYAEAHPLFATEDARTWAHNEGGLPLPPDGRAWGAVTNRAVRAGLIVRDHYRPTRIPPAHASPRPVWRSRIYCGAQAA